MEASLIIAIAQALISGIPKIIEAIKKGRDIKDMRIEEYVSHDALQKIKDANKKAQDYINQG
jgi:hypothetical protein